jgi:hypothetical protein
VQGLRVDARVHGAAQVAVVRVALVQVLQALRQKILRKRKQKLFETFVSVKIFVPHVRDVC